MRDGRSLIAFAVDTIELRSGSADDSYWRRWEELMPALIERRYDFDEASDAKHLRHTSAGTTIESAARQAGFVMGFEYCRRLLLGELDLETLKDGGSK